MADAGGSSSRSNTVQRVGKYEMVKTLGTGNTSVVKLGVNLHTGENVAIKVIDKKTFLGKKRGSNNNSLRNQKINAIKLEISIMKMIRHPNVVRVFEVMATKKKIYIVLELVDGGELFDKIDKTSMRGMREDQARHYFQQLMCAVDYFHNRGVSHRDLKPENLLVDAKGVLKVSDFGMSALPQQIKPDGLLHTACGTLQYTAPEVLRNNGYDGAKADIWSCGVILFFMNAAQLPFATENNDRTVVYRKINRAEFTFPPFFSTRLKRLIQRILDPNPATRIAMNEIFEDAWFKQDYQPPRICYDDKSEKLLAEIEEIGPSAPVTMMNAFEIMSTFMGIGIIGNLLDQVREKREAVFISLSSKNEIVAGIEHISKTLGFNVKKRYYKMSIKTKQAGRQGYLSIYTKISEIAPSCHMVELQMAGGDTLEFHRFYKDLCSGLQDIILKAEPIDAETDPIDAETDPIDAETDGAGASTSDAT